MLYNLILFIAVGIGGGGNGASDAQVVQAQQSSADFVAEDQTPSGKFLSATEVRPILGMTKGNWIAVREFNGQDLLYVTHLLSWRCGLHQIEYALNDGPYEVWPMEPCYADEAAPNAIKADDMLPYKSFELNSIETVRIRLLYDDLQTEEAEFNRSGVQIN